MCMCACLCLCACVHPNRTVKFWDLETFKCVSTSHPEASPIKCLAYSKDGKAIYSGGNDSFRVRRCCWRMGVGGMGEGRG